MADFPNLAVVEYDKIRADIRPGDLLMASGNYMLSKIIQRATDSVWSHVAFVMTYEAIDRVMVLESVESQGVRTIPLSQYVQNFEGTGVGYDGRIAIARHRDFAAKKTPQNMKAMTQFAVDRLAYPYDVEEIARIAARIVASAIGLGKEEIDHDQEYICSEYVYECYKRLGIDVPYDQRGFIAPADFAKDQNVDLLWELQVKC